jgi:rubredoxin
MKSSLSDVDTKIEGKIKHQHMRSILNLFKGVMIMLWKCSVCGYTHSGDEAPLTCPKCGAPKESFSLLSEGDAKKTTTSDRTNDIHMEIIGLAMRICDLAKEGIDINLDPPCVDVFSKAHKEALIIKQRSKAEIAGHISRGKW